MGAPSILGAVAGDENAPVRRVQLPEFAGRMRVVSQNFLRHVHREGHAVQVWVVNERADILRLLDWGVDGIIWTVPTLPSPRATTSGLDHDHRR